MKNGFVLVLFEQADRLVGHLAVGVLLVRAGLVRQKRHRGAQAPLGRVVHDVGFEGGLVASGRVEPLLPRRPVVQAARADVARVAVVVHLADAGDVVAVAAEHLRQCHHVGQVLAEMVLQVEHPRAVRPQTGQDRRAAWTAQRKLAVGPLEPHAACGQTVDARGLHERVAEAAEVVVHVVHGDEQDVLAPSGAARFSVSWLRLGRQRDEAWQSGSQSGPGRTAQKLPTIHSSPPVGDAHAACSSRGASCCSPSTCGDYTSLRPAPQVAA